MRNLCEHRKYHKLRIENINYINLTKLSQKNKNLLGFDPLLRQENIVVRTQIFSYLLKVLKNKVLMKKELKCTLIFV